MRKQIHFRAEHSKKYALNRETLQVKVVIYQVFADVNPTLQQNFITTRNSKFLSMVIYNSSTNIL